MHMYVNVHVVMYPLYTVCINIMCLYKKNVIDQLIIQIIQMQFQKYIKKKYQG